MPAQEDEGQEEDYGEEYGEEEDYNEYVIDADIAAEQEEEEYTFFFIRSLFAYQDILTYYYQKLWSMFQELGLPNNPYQLSSTEERCLYLASILSNQEKGQPLESETTLKLRSLYFSAPTVIIEPSSLFLFSNKMETI